MFPIYDDQTSKNAIYVELRRSIIMGHLAPNDRFDVAEISRKYNTSITPVRDALQMLSQEGLVNIKPRSGYFVAATTMKQLRDLLELRRIMELAAIEHAVLRITGEQIKELSSIHAGYTDDDDESYDRYTNENRQFHYLISKASGNNELVHLVGRLHDRLARFMVMRHAGQTMMDTHLKIIDALEAHDANAAREALLDDIERSHESILEKVLQQEEIESLFVG
jgi:DNA-binding GntR family transcriptional regulator